MTNTEEQRLTQRVLEQLRRDPGSQMSSGDLYAALGGQKVLRYTENEFRGFLREHCPFAAETESQGDENKSPKYALIDTLRRKRTNNISKGQPTNTHTPAGNGFDVTTDGYKSFLYAAKKLADYSGDGNFAWNELRKSYKKDTGRHLNVEELNLMIGTSNMTKCQILATQFNGLFEPLDSKALIVRMDSKKQYSELLKMRTASLSSAGSSSPSTCGHKKCKSLRVSSEESPSVSSVRDKPTKSEVLDNSFESKPEVLKEVMTGKNAREDEVFSNEHMNVLNSQTHFENDEETVHKFAESLIQHRNSLPDEFGDEIYGTKDAGDFLVPKTEEAEPDLSGVKSELELTGLTSNEQSTISNGMNAAFLADDSMRTSFCTPLEGSFETSGERGYLTCSEQLSDAAADVSLNISSTESVDPPTPRRTHEITLCSSRNGIATVLPQPDISPLCSANHLLDSPSVFEESQEHPSSVTPESAIEEPVPLPRKILSASSESCDESIEARKHDESSISVVAQGQQPESVVEYSAPIESSVFGAADENTGVSERVSTQYEKDPHSRSQDLADASVPGGDVQKNGEKSSEESQPTVEVSQPTVEVSQPTVEVSQLTVEEPQLTVEEPQLTVEEPQPTVEEPQPTVEEPQATVEEPQPTVEEPQPTVEESQPTVEESQPTVEEPQPNVEKPQLTVEESQPTVEESLPAVEKVKEVEVSANIVVNEVRSQEFVTQTDSMVELSPEVACSTDLEPATLSEITFIAASPAKPARSIPSITIQLEEETEKLLAESKEASIINYDMELIKSSEAEPSQCNVLDEEVEDLEKSVSYPTVDKVEDSQKLDQDVHGETFVEEVSILIEQAPKESTDEVNEKLVEDEPVRETAVADEQKIDDQDVANELEEGLSLLSRKSESTITVIQQPLTSNNSQVAAEEGSDSDSIPYDNDESSNSSSPAKTVTVEVELNASNVAQTPSSSLIEKEEMESAEVAIKKEIPESIPEDEMKSPVDDEPSRDPSIISEQLADKPEDDETNHENIQCLSPEAEMPEEGILVQKPEVNEKDSRRKSKKRTRIVAPRRRIFNCCTVL